MLVSLCLYFSSRNNRTVFLLQHILVICLILLAEHYFLTESLERNLLQVVIYKSLAS